MLANMDVKQNFKVNIAQNRGPKKGNKSVGSYGYSSGYVNNGNFYNNGYKGGYTSSSFIGNAFGSNSQFRGFQGDNQVGEGNWNTSVGSGGFNNGKAPRNSKSQWNPSKPTCQICMRTRHML